MHEHATSSQFGWAWLGLTLALAVHVTDEALNDFLSVYNPAVMAIRARWPFLWFPTFTFKAWLSGLVIAVVLLLALSPFAFRGAWWLIIPAYFLGLLMTANGLQHIVGSIYMRRMMPGVYSSPILLVCSSYLLLSARNRHLSACV
jgi:Protein of unknown function with HXXEE motif